jgi:hypothetical protein
MNGKPRLIVHGATAEEWTERYGVEPFSHPCSRCGRVLSTTVPFVQGTLRGLRAPACVCGNERTPYVIVRDPQYGDLFTGAEADEAVRSSSGGTGRRSVGRVLRWR